MKQREQEARGRRGMGAARAARPVRSRWRHAWAAPCLRRGVETSTCVLRRNFESGVVDQARAREVPQRVHTPDVQAEKRPLVPMQETRTRRTQVVPFKCAAHACCVRTCSEPILIQSLRFYTWRGYSILHTTSTNEATKFRLMLHTITDGIRAHHADARRAPAATRVRLSSS